MSMEDDGKPAPELQTFENPEQAAQEEKISSAPLSAEEQRVLGSLLEKAQTTPDHYPLTLNSLASACNQKSNREPVVEFDDEQILTALDSLQEKRFATRIAVAGSRVPKFKHTIENALPMLDERGIAMLTPLLLRGRQTLGELRTRTERMFHFEDPEAAQQCLDALAKYPDRPLVKHIPVGDGKRVPSFICLLGLPASDAAGPVGGAGSADVPVVSAAPVVASTAAAAVPVSEPNAELVADVAALRIEVKALREELDQLKSELGT